MWEAGEDLKVTPSSPFSQPQKKGLCTNPLRGCSCPLPALQHRQQPWEAASAVHGITLSEEADLRSMPTREEQKRKQHLGNALRLGLPSQPPSS